jgi:hypothetical protein
VNALLKKSLIAGLAAAGATAIQGQPATTAPAKPPASEFVMPAGPQDGRDPFFPESTRPYEGAVVAKPHAPVVETNIFTITGLSFEHGHEMVIINNHTFAPGDEGDVLSSGGRVHLKLIEIRAGAAVIEANGTRSEVPISSK